MKTKKVHFKVLRYKPGAIDLPRYQSYTLQALESMSILDGLEMIRQQYDAGLIYRHSCHHSSCGTCACRINGKERLACTTRVLALDSLTITLEPLKGFPVIADLMVDMTSFFAPIDAQWQYVRTRDGSQSSVASNGRTPSQQFETCIECAACVSACPVGFGQTGFMGPAALAALNNQIKNAPHQKSKLLRHAQHHGHIDLCERALKCSAVCPTRVYPARHIADLQRAVEKLTD
jgi:succinate dehydrogenase / fumarate reductase iron-sulfur subunit